MFLLFFQTKKKAKGFFTMLMFFMAKFLFRKQKCKLFHLGCACPDAKTKIEIVFNQSFFSNSTDDLLELSNFKTSVHAVYIYIIKFTQKSWSL